MAGLITGGSSGETGKDDGVGETFPGHGGSGLSAACDGAQEPTGATAGANGVGLAGNGSIVSVLSRMKVSFLPVGFGSFASLTITWTFFRLKKPRFSMASKWESSKMLALSDNVGKCDGGFTK